MALDAVDHHFKIVRHSEGYQELLVKKTGDWGLSRYELAATLAACMRNIYSVL
jgi:hypothetical protein